MFMKGTGACALNSMHESYLSDKVSATASRSAALSLLPGYAVVSALLAVTWVYASLQAAAGPAHQKAGGIFSFPLVGPVVTLLSPSLVTHLLFGTTALLLLWTMRRAISALLPLRTLERAVHQVAAGEIEMPVSLLSSRGDVGRLARNVEQMRWHLIAEVEAVDRGQTEFSAAEDHFHAVYAAIACGVVVFDDNGALFHANVAAERILGMRLAAESAYTLSTLFPEPLHGAAVVHDVVCAMNRADGSTAWLQVDAVPVPDASGALAQTVVSFVDITERFTSESQLRASEDLLHTVTANAPIIINAIDAEGVFTFSDGLGLATLGLEPGQLVGQSAYTTYWDHPDIIANMRKAFAGETTTHIEEMQGTVWSSQMSPLFGEDGAVVSLVVVATDITARARAEAEVRMSEQRFRALTEQSDDLVCVLTPAGEVTYESPSYQRVFGASLVALQQNVPMRYQAEKSGIRRRPRGATQADAQPAAG